MEKLTKHGLLEIMKVFLWIALRKSFKYLGKQMEWIWEMIWIILAIGTPNFDTPNNLLKILNAKVSKVYKNYYYCSIIDGSGSKSGKSTSLANSNGAERSDHYQWPGVNLAMSWYKWQGWEENKDFENLAFECFLKDICLKKH